MHKPVLIIALLVAAALGLPTTGVDRHGVARRPETTEIEPNETLQDPAQGSGSINPIEVREELTPETPRPKRGLCIGFVSVCSEQNGMGAEVANKILDSNQQNLATAVKGFNDLAATLTRIPKNRQRTRQQTDPDENEIAAY